jgi:hypothetical protein
MLHDTVLDHEFRDTGILRCIEHVLQLLFRGPSKLALIPLRAEVHFVR